jgi:hypothetical protein
MHPCSWRAAERMASTIQELMSQQLRATPEDGCVRLLRKAGYQHIASVLRVMAGGMETWIAR